MNWYRSQNSSLIDIVYDSTNSSVEMKLHHHNSHEMIYVEEGTVNFVINNREYTVKENSLIFISNFESHEFKVLSYPYKRYFILIRPEYFHSVIDEPILASIFKQRPEHFRHVIKIKEYDGFVYKKIKNMYMEAKMEKEFKKSLLGSQLNILFVMLYRNYKNSFPVTVLDNAMKTIVEIQRYVDENLLNKITLKDIAMKFYMDMYYLSHLFKKVTGFNFKEYLILQRISKARELLAGSNDNVTLVALNSGFNNVNHFIRIFKKYEGITPYQYRKTFRNKSVK